MSQADNDRASTHSTMTTNNPAGWQARRKLSSLRAPSSLRQQREPGRLQTGNSLAQYSTPPLEQVDTPQTRIDGNDTTPTVFPWQTAEEGENYGDWSERKQEGHVNVENDYYSLNPWYGQRPDKPVFGLASPLPRTVRPGMWRGKRDLRDSMYKVDEEGEVQGDAERLGGTRHRPGVMEGQPRRSEDDCRRPSFGKDYFPDQNIRPQDQQAVSDLQVPLDSRSTSSPPSHFDASIDGRKDSARRVPRHDTDRVFRDRGIDEHGLRYTDSSTSQQREFGLADGLPPLQEHKSIETTQTQKEKHEIQHREEEARQEYYNTYRNPLARLRAQYPQASAEWLATTLYIFLGLAGNLSALVSNGQSGTFETECWAWGIAATVGIYVGGGISGSHLNPCVSIALSIYRGFPWRMCIVYILCQMVAGLCAGALAWAIYRDAILHYDPGLTPSMTGKAFYGLPQTWVSWSTAFFNDFTCMAIWVCTAFAIGDDQNSPPGAGMSAVVFGFITFLMSITMGYNTGLAISPARDFGPRLVAYWVGYGKETFTSGWWIVGPWAASLSGALVGGLVYDALIFVGGESPVNYRWPKPSELRTKAKQKNGSKKNTVKDKINSIV